MQTDLFKVNMLYAPDDKAGNASSAPKDDTADDKTEGEVKKEKRVEFTAEQQAAIDGIVQERLKRQREKLDADAKATAEKAKTDAEQAALKEQGKFKELAEAEKVRADKIEAEKADLAKKLTSMQMQSAFQEAAGELEIEFADKAAQQDAFEKLDPTTVGEDFKGMKDALKKLIKERPYLFREEKRTNLLDASARGKGNSKQVGDALVAAKKATGSYSAV